MPKDEADPKTLGNYLKSLRTGANMKLRQVEEATGKEISNAYLSQLENGKISKPSPSMLYSLATIYGTSYEGLMKRAGYLPPSSVRPAKAKHGRAATFSIENLTVEEEQELLEYLAWYRSKRRKQDKEKIS